METSRLARSSADWHQLLDLCALTQTLIADADGVYSPGEFNDRLLLGLKGTMSEYELNLLRQRGLAARDSKAGRGALRFTLPPGLVWSEDGRIELDPDERVQEAIRLAEAYGGDESPRFVNGVLDAMAADGRWTALYDEHIKPYTGEDAPEPPLDM